MTIYQDNSTYFNILHLFNLKPKQILKKIDIEQFLFRRSEKLKLIFILGHL